MGKYISYIDKDYKKVDKRTGEMVELVHHRRITTEQFIMVYMQLVPDMMKLECGQMKFLMGCWCYSDYSINRPEGNTFINNEDFKRYLREDMELSITDSTINSNLSRLVKKGFLVRRSKGSYMLNPKYFFKGTITNRTRLVLQLENEHKRQKSEEYKNKFEDFWESSASEGD